MDEKPVQLDKVDARQGKANLGVRYVLIGGLILVVLAFIIISLVHH